MTKTIARTILALVFAFAAAPALAGPPGSGVDISIHYGVDKYDSVGLRSGLSGTDFSSSQQLEDASQSMGATVIARLGILRHFTLWNFGNRRRSVVDGGRCCGLIRNC